MSTIILVSCVKKKQSQPAPAQELYISTWFCKVRSFVKTLPYPWYILSAKYGIVHPDTVIQYYDKTLLAMSATERRTWSKDVFQQLQAFPRLPERLIFFAGERYREHLIPLCHARKMETVVPLAGLPIGKQLAWLSSSHHPAKSVQFL